MVIRATALAMKECKARAVWKVEGFQDLISTQDQVMWLLWLESVFVSSMCRIEVACRRDSLCQLFGPNNSSPGTLGQRAMVFQSQVTFIWE